MAGTRGRGGGGRGKRSRGATTPASELQTTQTPTPIPNVTTETTDSQTTIDSQTPTESQTSTEAGGGEGEWCDARAEKAVQMYEEKMLEKHPCDVTEQSSVIPFDSNAWLEVTAISKKKQPYGFAKSYEAKKKVTSPSCSMQSHPLTLTSLEIEEQIEKEVANRVASHVDVIRAEIEEKMKVEMDAKEARVLAEMEKMRQLFESTRKP